MEAHFAQLAWQRMHMSTLLALGEASAAAMKQVQVGRHEYLDAG